MDILLDTNALIWLIIGDDSLPQDMINEIEKSNNRVYYSMASIFEISIKKSINRLDIINCSINELVNMLKSGGILELQIKPLHLEYYVSFAINKNHRDPYDRLLISQSIQESMFFCTCDDKIKNKYNNLNGFKLLPFNKLAN